MYLNLKSIIFSKKLLLSMILTAFLFTELRAQLLEGYKAEVELQAIGTTNRVVPFWMRSNQYGSLPLSGISGSIIGRFTKDYSELTPNEEIYGKNRIIDWGFGIEGRANGGNKSNLQLIEAYIKAKASIFQIKAGRSKDVMGLNGDTSLSSGNFALSGNALGIPKVEVSIPNYWRVPIFGDIFSIKGTFSHGWLGRTRIYERLNDPEKTDLPEFYNNYPITYFHQKSLYVALGKKDWKLTLYGGFNHQVYWDDLRSAYGDEATLSKAETFFYVVTGKPYATNKIGSSKIGNQLGSIDIGASYKFQNYDLLIYRQNFYDVGALAKLANIADGLNGISITNNTLTNKSSAFMWSKILFEVFYSKNQAGYPWSKLTKSGDEDYYNNYYFREGWSYMDRGLGNPLITQKTEARPGQASATFDHFINNRLLALHFGMAGKWYDWNLFTKASYSWNHGTFATSKYGKSTGDYREGIDENNLFKKVQQLSFVISAEKDLSNKSRFGFSLFTDQGRLLKSSFGLQMKFTQSL